MKAVILGAGMQGTACAFDMARFGNFEKIILADIDIEKAKDSVKKIETQIPASAGTRIELTQIDLNNFDEIVKLIDGAKVVVSAAPYFLNLNIAKACIKAKANFCDMGGNTDIVFRELALDKEAKDAGICIIPDSGLAPGLANIVAAYGITKFDEVDAVKIRVGGLPQVKRPPLDYKLVFSAYGLINEYSGTSFVIRDGEIEEVDTLTELETLEIESLGTFEAFHTSGGISTMTHTYRGRVKNMDYKTIRYPGHLEKLHILRDLGLMDNSPIRIKDKEIIPRDVLVHLLTVKLDFPQDKDLIIMMVEVTGKKDGVKKVLRFDMLDYHDEENDITAMMRTTAYPVSITAIMLAEEIIKEKGAYSPEIIVPGKEMMEELAKRNIKITINEKN